MNTRAMFALTTAGLLAAMPALAQVSATAATDLNFRAGPSGDQEILGVIPVGGEVTVLGCLEGSSWCQVDVQGTQGWAFGDYLNATVESETLVITTDRDQFESAGLVILEADGEVDSADSAEATTTAEAAQGAAGAVVGAGAGATLAAALIGGPAAIAAGAALGAAASTGEVGPAVTYAQENPVDPVYLDGEVIVGAGIPEEIEVIEIPETQYSYLNVNGLPVVVDNESRQIVQIVRQ